VSNPNLIGGGDAAPPQLPQSSGDPGPNVDDAYWAQMRNDQIGVDSYMAIPGQLPRAGTYEAGKLQPMLIEGNFSASTLQMLVSNVLPYARLHGMPGEGEVPPGCSAPLSPLEREWVADMLAAGA
jgi:hypothetical protein